MNFVEVINSTAGKVQCWADENSPAILTGIGIVGIVASTVLACKATLKANDILEEHHENLENIKKAKEKADSEEGVEYTEKDIQRDKTSTYVHTVGRFAKEYAPAIIVGVISIGCIMKGHDILSKRNAALTAAYTLVDKAYHDYRENVVDRFGKEVDDQLKDGIKIVEKEEVEVDAKGKEHKRKIAMPVTTNTEGSGFTVYFTRSNPNWSDNEDFVTMFFRAQQNWANDLLRSRKYSKFPKLTWNEVLGLIDIDGRDNGLINGWSAHKGPYSDGYVQFDVRKITIMNDLGEYEPAYSIEFNVDRAPIYGAPKGEKK